MNKWRLGGAGACLGTSVLLILLALCYFFFQPRSSDISEEVNGDSNIISNTEKKEISLFHIENLNNQLSDLEGHVNTHHTVKYCLIGGIVIVLVVVMIYKCTNIPKDIKANLRRKELDEKVECQQE